MKKAFILIAAAAAMTFVSCSKFDNERQQIAQKNKEAFEKAIGGTIDPEQNWNMAESEGITVNTSTPSEIRVYASDGSSLKLTGSYTISGTEKVTFDAAKNVKEVYVANMTSHKAQVVALGGTADFASTATKAYIENTDETVTTNEISTYKEFNYNTIVDLFSKDNTASDIFYVAFDEFDIYPVYWDAAANNTVGIYYYNLNGDRVNVDLFEFDKQGDFVQRSENGKYWSNVTGNSPFSKTQQNDEFNNNNYNKKNWQRLHSKGIHVKFPAGTVFGFYTRNDYDGNITNYYYSDAALNKDGASHTTLINTTIDGKSCSFIAFEDQEIKSTDKGDFNDLAFYIDDAKISTLDNTVHAWTLAVEDMGSDNDYDFNDIVISVAHVAGTTTADIELLAAGGVVESYLYYKDQLIGGIHNKLGQETPSVVNTNYYRPHVEPVKFTVTVDKDFTMCGTYMGGFTFKNEFGSSIIATQDKGSVPYMICIPSSWYWPLERTNIMDAYPDFATFAKDHNSATNWYTNCVEDKVYISANAPEKDL